MNTTKLRLKTSKSITAIQFGKTGERFSDLKQDNSYPDTNSAKENCDYGMNTYNT